ncbi:PorT family protein, partial [Bacteroidales bacterium OttesenSCG-928-C19]|nr:PorT family protein [Bacteroidales bacterium OttesenSCG-928-C19]
MKKLTMILTLAVAFTMGTKAYAQEGFSFGVKAGGNLSKFYGEDGFDEGKMKFGFQVGATVEYGFTDNLFLGSGLEFTTKGIRYKRDLTFPSMVGTDNKATLKTTQTPMYLQLPIHIGYKFNITDKINIILETGPYIAFGLGGKVKQSLDGTDRYDFDIDFTDFFGDEESGRAKRFDFGISNAIGTELGNVVIKIGYEWGLMNIARKQTIELSNEYDMPAIVYDIEMK